jgi:hypothetical protein
MQIQVSIVLIVVVFMLTSLSASLAQQAGKTARGTSTTKNESQHSKRSGDLTEQDAVELVRKRPDVQRFLRECKKVETPKMKAVVEFDHKEGSEYVVHVYQIVPDDAKTYHTATMEWFRVDAKTGKISRTVI